MIRIPSKSDPSVMYTVDMVRRTCTCPGYRYRRTCRHLRELEDAIPCEACGARPAHRRGLCRDCMRRAIWS